MRQLAMCMILLSGLSCGANDGGTVIGSAGGTVTGPNGATVVIPPGALARDVTIDIEQTSAGAPPLPDGRIAFGPMFAFTPHGTTFAVPVTMTLPFDAAALPAGRTPAFYKTDGQNQWRLVANPTFGADAVSAQVMSFSLDQVVIEPLVRNDPVREWSFGEYRGDALEEVTVDSGRQVGGFLNELFDFGPAFDDSGYLFDDGIELPPDGIATADIGSTENGVSYWVDSEAPQGIAGLPNDPIGGIARLKQTQSFIKRAQDAKLTFTVSLASLVADDYNAILGRSCPEVHADGLVCDLIHGELYLEVSADTATRNLFHTAGGATLKGFAESWDSDAWNYHFSRTPLWSIEDFDFVVEGGDDGESEAHVTMDLRRPRTYSVNISSVGIDEEFTLTIVAFAEAFNRIAGPPSEFPTSANAYLRDPLEIGGTTLTLSGLEATNNPLSVLPVEVPVAPAPCVPGPGPDPAAGVLQLSAPSYTVAESSRSPAIRITRTGGTRGAVTATFTASDGTASSGADYSPVTATVFFADGDAAPRAVLVPILQDQIDEPDETVNLTLSEPGGCAALGAQTAAVLTIRDDDDPAPPTSGVLDTSFGTEGKVTTGDVDHPFGGDLTAMALQPDGKIVLVGGSTADFMLARYDTAGRLDASFDGDGKVTTDIVTERFSEEAARGVAVQADGKIVVVGYGTIAGRPVGSRFGFVLARYRPDGTLDPTFGSGGTVTNLVIGQAFAVAIQPDHKIVVVGSAPVSPANVENDFVVARFLEDGGLDATFKGGVVTTDFDLGIDFARNVVLQPDGAILVSGEIQTRDQTAVARYDALGNLDPTFGDGGKVKLVGVRAGEGLALQGDGKVVLAGSVDVGVLPAVTTQFALRRLKSDGSADDTFGSGGAVSTSISGLGDGALAVALQSDGKIVVAGRSSIQTNSNFAVARYTAAGALDTSFAGTGKLTIDFGFVDSAENVAVQPDGKIVIGGLARNIIDAYGLARVLP